MNEEWYHTKSKRTLGVRDFYAFAVEWQRVTGRLLMTQARTREDGEWKLQDAEARQELFDTLLEQGLI